MLSPVHHNAGILLHTTNGGKDWTRIPLSAKLPGAPIKVTALPGEGAAEMCTESGAIYVTDNTAYTWKAAVQETVDATLNRTVSSGISGASYYEGSFANIVRSKAGSYIGVSSRGNFYMTWSPGDSAWMPHNRPATRRIQNLGWTDDDHIWVTTRGGDVLVSDDDGVNAENFSNARINSRGFGLLDIGCFAPLSSCVLFCPSPSSLAVCPLQLWCAEQAAAAGSGQAASASRAAARAASSSLWTAARHSSASRALTKFPATCMQSRSTRRTRASFSAMMASSCATQALRRPPRVLSNGAALLVCATAPPGLAQWLQI